MMKKLITRIITSITAVLIKFMWLGNIKGTQKIPPYPCIIIANHESYLDFLLIGYSLVKKAQIPFKFWAKTKVVNHALWKKYSEIFNAIEVKGNGGFNDLLETSRQAIKSGDYICIFPEGTRSRNGELLPFKLGYLKLASTLGMEVVPVFLENTFHAWPPFKRLPRRKKCNVTFFPSIKISQDMNRSDMEKINKSIMNKYSELKNY